MPGWKRPEDNRILGRSYPRLDGPIKATGRAKYAYDINLPGMLYGRILRSPHAKARIKSIDTSAAEAMPGVKAVIIRAKPGDVMRYQGQELGGLAAVSTEVAEDALRAIKVVYEVLPHSATEAASLRPGAPTVLDGMSNLTKNSTRSNGDPDAAFAKCAAVHEGFYSCPVRQHASLETHGCVVRWDTDEKMTCWASTQHVVGFRDDMARYFKLKPENCHVITEVMGGGFGSKFGAGYEGILCGDLAKKAGAPVKLMLTRKEEHIAVGNAPSASAKIKIGCDKDGKVTAFFAESRRSGGVQTEGGELPYIYDVGTFKAVNDWVLTNTGPSRAWRAPNHPQSSFLMECAMEDLAVTLGIDPLELRLKNDPSKMRQKQWREGARLIGWDRRNKKPGVGTLAGTGRFRRGLGCGAAVWFSGGVPGSKCRVTISPAGEVVGEIGVQDIGTGVRTLVASIIAEELGIGLQDVQPRIGHSLFPPGCFSGGSVTTPSTAPPVKRAAEAAKAKLADAVAAKLQVAADAVEMDGGRVFAKGSPAKGMTFKEACALLSQPIDVIGDYDATLAQPGVAGCQFFEVEVDTETGHVRVLKAVALQDGGIILNRLTYESQINGGVIQGIGMALLEDRVSDQQSGRILNADLDDYRIPGPMEMPEFVSVPFENPDATGVTGMAEPTAIPTAAAIRNAILNATGAAVNECPMTRGRVLTALAEARKRGVKV
jgi:xanthine dehydrogenase YagR molybdenum-binding subunit